MEPKTSPLFERLSDDARKDSLLICLKAMDCTSVFDIVRRSKSGFASMLREHDVAGVLNADEIYDNAVVYAIQIHRAFLEHELHRESDAPVPARTGVRGLIETRPDYPTLFKENWEAFCRAGAFESRYGPAAYLCELYEQATQTFEKAYPEDSPKRIKLAQRRPDLAAMLVDPAAMNEPMPMLTLTNDILASAIDEYRKRVTPDDTRPLYQVFAERQYPLNFPYHLPHEQIRLVLATRKLTLGGLKLLAMPLDRLLYGENRLTEIAYALCLAGRLSPPQQAMLAVPPPFAMYNLTIGDLSDAVGWDGPKLVKLMIDLPPDGKPANASRATVLTFYSHIQAGVVEGPPESIDNNPNAAMLYFPRKASPTVTLQGWFVDENTPPLVRPMDERKVGTEAGPEDETRRRRFRLTAGTVPPLPDYSARFAIAPVLSEGSSVNFGEIVAAFDIALHFKPSSPEDYTLSSGQQQYLQTTLDAALLSGRQLPFDSVRLLCERLDISTEELDRLLARGDYAPTLSPNVVVPPVMRDSSEYEAAADASYHYGAVYVHAGLPEAMSLYDASSDPSLPQWKVSGLTLDRLDRLQRMCRMQRWTGLSFEELDGLVAAASHAEARHTHAWLDNPARLPLALTLSTASMRALSGFRYFHDRFGIGAGDFSALLDRLAVHGLGGKRSLFDRWFNNAPSSASPLILDHSALNPAAATKICAALGLPPAGASYTRVAAAIGAALPSTPLVLSRKVVSAFFRFGRSARVFGIDAGDLLAVLEMIGGQQAANRFVKTRLRAEDEVEPFADTLDLLVQVAGVTDWLAANRWNVVMLFHLLHLDEGRLAADEGLVRFVSSLADNLAPALVRASTLVHPDLTPEVDWMAVLDSLPEPLVDAHGLVATLERQSAEDQLSALKTLLASADIPLTDEVTKQKAIAALAACVLAAWQAQERALGVSMNQTMGVPQDIAPLVASWAGQSPEGGTWTVADFLARTLNLAAVDKLAPEDIDAAYLDKVYAIRRHALVREATAMSTPQLDVFLRHPERFGLASDRLSLDALYLLTRYREWREQAEGTEDALLAYLGSGDSNDMEILAPLLGWTSEELKNAIAGEPDTRSWRTLNALLCRKAACERSGLSAATLRKLEKLSPDDEWAVWTEAGDAVMASLPVDQP